MPVYTSDLDSQTYTKLLARYKDIPKKFRDTPGTPSYDFEPYLTESSTDRIDSDYMESRFTLYCKPLDENFSQADKDAVEKDLHDLFATLSSEDHVWADRVLYDIHNGVLDPEGRRLSELIALYKVNHENDRVKRFSVAIGVDEEKLRILKRDYDGTNIDLNGRFEELKDTLDLDVARKFIESIDGRPLKDYEVRIRADSLLRKFIEEDIAIGIE